MLKLPKFNKLKVFFVLFLFAIFYCQNQFVSVASAASNYDLDVTYIERTPRYNFDSSKKNPAVGDSVKFTVHIKNRGTSSLSTTKYRWFIDGVQVKTGSLSSISPNNETTAYVNWSWKSGSHTVKFQSDTDNRYTEISETNNTLEEKTNALPVGFWVERSLYDWFNLNQVKLGIGANSWEDWAQRQITNFNNILSQSIFDSAPNGAIDRVRLDKVIVVADGALPLNGGLATNNPDTRDKTVDLMWGFPKNGLLNSGFYDILGQPRTYIDNNNPFYIENTLIHELSHARYLIDEYAWNLNPHLEMDDVKVLKKDGSKLLETGINQFYQCEGGIMTCSAPAGKEFLYSQLNVMALNKIAGQRATCGNYNAPCNFGDYLKTLPQDNIVKILDANSLPIPNVKVDVYQSIQDPFENFDFYDKLIDNIPDISCVTNQSGTCSIGPSPFGAINNGWDASYKGSAVIKITVGQVEYFEWFYLSKPAVEYMKGNVTQATYDLKVDYSGPIPSPLGDGLTAEYFDNNSLTGNPVIKRVDPIVNFNWGDYSPNPIIPNDNFSIRWSGKIMPEFSENYTFYATMDDAVRMYVNGTKILDNWSAPTAGEMQGTFTLQAGVQADVIIEYYESWWGANAKLEWSSSSQPRQIIPQDKLFSIN